MDIGSCNATEIRMDAEDTVFSEPCQITLSNDNLPVCAPQEMNCKDVSAVDTFVETKVDSVQSELISCAEVTVDAADSMQAPEADTSQKADNETECGNIIPSGEIHSASRLAGLISMIQGKVDVEGDDDISDAESSDDSTSEDCDDSEDEESSDDDAQYKGDIVDKIGDGRTQGNAADVVEDLAHGGQTRDNAEGNVLDIAEQADGLAIEESPSQGDAPDIFGSLTLDEAITVTECLTQEDPGIIAENPTGSDAASVALTTTTEGPSHTLVDSTNDETHSQPNDVGDDVICDADSVMLSHIEQPTTAVVDAIVIDTDDDDDTELTPPTPKLPAMSQAIPSCSLVEPPISDSAYSVFEKPAPASRKRVAAFTSNDLDKYLNTQSKLNVSSAQNDPVPINDKKVEGHVGVSGTPEKFSAPNVDNVDGVTFLSYDSRKAMLADVAKKCKLISQQGVKGNEDRREKTRRISRFPDSVKLDSRLFREVDASALGLQLSNFSSDPAESSTAMRKVGKIYGRKSNGKFASKLVLHKRGSRAHNVGMRKKSAVSGAEPGGGSMRPPLEALYITEQMALSAVCALKRLNCDKPGCLYGCICYMCGPCTPSPPPPLPTPPMTPNCDKEYCRLGCICDSLSGDTTKRQRREPTMSSGLQHCGRIDCMFGCVCSSVTQDGVRKSVRLRDKPRISDFQHVKSLVFFDPTVMLVDNQEQHKRRHQPKSKKKKVPTVKLRVLPSDGDKGSSQADDVVRIEISSDEESSSTSSKVSSCSKPCETDDRVTRPIVPTPPPCPVAPELFNTLAVAKLAVSMPLRTQMVVLERRNKLNPDGTTSEQKHASHLLQIQSDCKWEVHRLRVLGLLAALADMHVSEQQTVPECVSICGLDVCVLGRASVPTHIPSRLHGVLHANSMHAVRIRITAQQPPELSQQVTNPPDLLVGHKMVSPDVSAASVPQVTAASPESAVSQKSASRTDTALGISGFNGMNLTQQANGYISAARNALHIALQGGDASRSAELAHVPPIPNPVVSHLMKHLVSGAEMPKNAVYPLAIVRNRADKTAIDVRLDRDTEGSGGNHPWELGPPDLTGYGKAKAKKKRRRRKELQEERTMTAGDDSDVVTKRVDSSAKRRKQMDVVEENVTVGADDLLTDIESITGTLIKQEMNDLAYSSGSVASSPLNDGSAANRVKSHNSLERARRSMMANVFVSLAEAADVRGPTTKVRILAMARERIKYLESSDVELSANLNYQKQHNKTLKQELCMLRAELKRYTIDMSNSPVSEPPAVISTGVTISHDDDPNDQSIVYIVDSDSDSPMSPQSICEDTCDSVVDLSDDA